MSRIILKHITQFKLGGPAEVVVARNTKKIPFLLEGLIKKKKKFYIIGGGTNIIANDKGYGGVVVHMKTNTITANKNIIQSDAGVLLERLINTANKRGLRGLETLAGIPGTVGGAVYGNAGAYGEEIKNVIQNVIVFDGKKMRTLSKKQCGFDYRESIFKKRNWAILSVVFSFSKGNKKILQKTSRDIIALRLKKYKPSLRCAGSIFKNIPVQSALGRRLRNKIPSDKIKGGKIPAGILLESVGAKGMRKGGIMVAHHHGNLIVNTGNGTARDAKYLIDVLKKKVRKKFGITLEEEVQYLGFEK